MINWYRSTAHTLFLHWIRNFKNSNLCIAMYAMYCLASLIPGKTEIMLVPNRHLMPVLLERYIWVCIARSKIWIFFNKVVIFFLIIVHTRREQYNYKHSIRMLIPAIGSFSTLTSTGNYWNRCPFYCSKNIAYTWFILNSSRTLD